MVEAIQQQRHNCRYTMTSGQRDVDIEDDWGVASAQKDVGLDV